MELTELSLAPTQFVVQEKYTANSSSSESDNKPAVCRKRKLFIPSSSNHHHHPLLKINSTSVGPPASPPQTSVDLQVNDPLPLDWEQCLDLESGRKYYLNRKTLRKSWNLPKDQMVDLELNISSTISSSSNYPHHHCNDQTRHHQDGHTNNNINNISSSMGSSGCNMVALACLNCHLLVILSKSSPSCPNCKYVHSLPTLPTPQTKVVSHVKSLNTLSLLN